MLESSNRLEEIIERSIQFGFRHVCLTDHNSMYGVMKFWHLCKEKGVHPIIGLETEIQIREKEYHFILLAKNDSGLQGLYHLSTLKNTWDYKVSFEEFVQCTSQCIVLSAGDYQDQLANFIEHKKEEELKEILKFFSSMWNDFYVSIAMNDSSYHRSMNQYLKEIAKSMQIETVAVSRILYKEAKDNEKLKILRAISKQTDIYDENLDVANGRFLRSKEEMYQLYEEEDLIQTDKIASLCNVQMAFEKSQLPTFENKLGVDSTTYLKKLCLAGLKKRLNGQYNPIYVQRLEYELNTIIKMGFTNYFLIVWDFIRYARSQDIMVGPGRGSAAGSLVAYSLGITHIDPIKNHLLFERFLNPERVTMPDIDTDFPDKRRDEVIDYVRDLYGKTRVSHIVSFNTLKAKAVLKDVGRVKRMPNRKVEALTKLIGNTLNMTLIKAYNEIPRFKKEIDRDREYRDLFETCLPLEGLPRHISTHAGGVIISNQDIEKVCPLVQIDADNYATQFTMEYLEELGLIKMDFLAVRNLSTIHQIVTTLQEKEHISIHVLKLPLNDSKTFQLLARADTIGVFQLESSGIKQLIKKMRPNKFEDICAILALYRPGPMHNIDEYILRKQDPSKIEYIHPALEPILKETYGIMIYQEQIMQIAQKIGNFTLAQADIFRRAMSKKKLDLMASYKEQFIQGALQNKCTMKQAVEIFETMEKFAEYGFNKSHSYAYGLVVYQMAYLKANYPLYFYQCLLDSVMGSENKTSEYIYECNDRDIKVLGPHVNFSKEQYEIEKNAIRMPLQLIKGIGKTIYPVIINEREKGYFKDFQDCIVRLFSRKINESTMLSLIYAGAMDGLEYNRKTMAENLKDVLNYASIISTETKDGVLLNYDVVSPPQMTRYQEDRMKKSQKEFESLGFYLTLHPVKEMREKQFLKCVPLRFVEQRQGYMDVIGKVVGYRTHKTKNGDWMCFMTIEDENAKVDVVIMPILYNREKDKIAQNKIVYVSGKKDRPQSILVNSMKWIEV